MRSRLLPLLILIVLLSHLGSLAVLKFVPENAACVLQAAPGRIESLASLVASFAFTMLGFLAAVLALFGIMSRSSLLARYRKRGHLTVLLIIMGVTMLELVATFALSINLYFVQIDNRYVQVMAWLITTDLVMLLFSTLPVIMLVKGTLDTTKTDAD